MKIRPEQSTDINQIQNVNVQAFTNHPHSKGNEYQIVNRLRNENALKLSLVAENETGKVIGHIAFSPVLINGENLHYYGLGPVAVLPEMQKRGIGSALIKAGIEEIKKLKGAGVVVLGEPEYYHRFGFKNRIHLILRDVPAEYFMVYSFGGDTPTGNVDYHSSFSR